MSLAPNLFAALAETIAEIYTEDMSAEPDVDMIADKLDLIAMSFNDADEPIAVDFSFVRDGKRFRLRFELTVEPE